MNRFAFYQKYISQWLAFLYLSGIAVSHYLSIKHVDAKIAQLLKKSSDDGICGAYSVFSCHEAANSEFGKFLGISIASIGEAYYLSALLMLFILVIFAFKKQLDEKQLLLNPHAFASIEQQQACAQSWKGIAFTALFFLKLSAVLSVIYSLFLAGVSIFYLGKLCPFCILLYVINALIFVSLHPHLNPLRSDVFKSGILKRYLLTPWHSIVIIAFSAFLLLMNQNTLAYERALRLEHKEALYQEPIPKLIQGIEIDQSPTQGTGEITIYEFSDFQCPFCKRLAKHLKEAQAQNPNIKYVFKNFPLSSRCNEKLSTELHKDACIAAKAGICAQNQGKFWEMHDLMFENQNDLAQDELLTYALQIKLDLAQFEACLNSEATEKRLKADVDLAIKIGVQGTPIFVIKHWGFVGAKPAEEILKLVEKYKDKAP
jgi:protein-disulfide isomerase/uncharacterized membrane protein